MREFLDMVGRFSPCHFWPKNSSYSANSYMLGNLGSRKLMVAFDSTYYGVLASCQFSVFQGSYQEIATQKVA